MGIPRQLEGLDPMRFEIVTLPDIVDGGLTDSLTGGHESTTPLRHALGLGAERGVHNGLDLLRAISRFTAPPGSNLPQTFRAALGKAGAPQGDRLTTHL